MIYFKPFLGLANRMRAINSAIALSKVLKTKIKIIWVKDFGLNEKFTSLFKLPSDQGIEFYQPSISVYNFPVTIRFPKYMKVVKTLLKMKHSRCLFLNTIEREKIEFEKLDASRGLFITAYDEFYPAEFDKKLFLPTNNIIKEIENIEKEFNESTYGMHIRRTDNKESIKSSPSALFETELDKIIDENSEAKFYLATDSDDEKNYFKEKYGDRIISKYFKTSRRSSEGMKNAVVDLFVLSKTKMIIGSYWSSFSEIASKIGNIPLKIVKI